MDVVQKLRDDREYLGQVYIENKEYCINFMSRMHNDYSTLSDIYQDAIIVLFEKAQNKNFCLTCSTQTYLNSICRNQLLNKFKSKVSPLNISDEYLPEVNDWLEDYDLEKENKLNAIESALYELKRTSNKCFEILHRFYYLRHSMKDIASALNYTNDKNAKTQKSKCKKRLEQLSKNQIDRNE